MNFNKKVNKMMNFINSDYDSEVEEQLEEEIIQIEEPVARNKTTKQLNKKVNKMLDFINSDYDSEVEEQLEEPRIPIEEPVARNKTTKQLNKSIKPKSKSKSKHILTQYDEYFTNQSILILEQESDNKFQTIIYPELYNDQIINMKNDLVDDIINQYKFFNNYYANKPSKIIIDYDNDKKKKNNDTKDDLITTYSAFDESYFIEENENIVIDDLPKNEYYNKLRYINSHIHLPIPISNGKWGDDHIYTNLEIKMFIKNYYTKSFKNGEKIYESVNPLKLSYLINNFWDHFDRSNNNHVFNYNRLRIYKMISYEGVNLANYHRKITDQGRLMSSNHNLQQIKSEIRNFLCDDIYYDIDAVNCCFNITNYICKKNNIEATNIDYYCKNTTKVRNELYELNPKIKKGIVKTSLTSMLYGKKSNSFKNIKFNNYVRNLYKEMECVRNKISKLDEFKEIELQFNKHKSTLNKISFINHYNKNKENSFPIDNFDKLDIILSIKFISAYYNNNLNSPAEIFNKLIPKDDPDYSKYKADLITWLKSKRLNIINKFKLEQRMKTIIKIWELLGLSKNDLKSLINLFMPFFKQKKNFKLKNQNSIFSHLIQKIENELLNDLRETLKTKKIINNNYIPMFDGIMIPQRYYHYKFNNYNINSVIEEFNNKLKNKYNYPFKFINKPMTTNIKMIEKVPIDSNDDSEIDDDSDDYDDMAEFHKDLEEIKELEKIIDKSITIVNDLNKIRYFNVQEKTYLNYAEKQIINNKYNIKKIDKIVDQRYLEIDDILKEKKTVSIISNMDTGKTTAILKYIKDNPELKVLFVSFRRTLASKYVEDLKTAGLNFTNYEDIKDNDFNSYQYPRLICQINSFWKVNGKYDLLILDEFSYTYNMIYAFCKINIFGVYNSFISYLSKCDKVFICDALLNQNNIDLINKFRPDNYVIKNLCQPNKRKVMIYSKPVLETKIAKSIAEHKSGDAPIIILSSSKIFLDKRILALVENANKKYIYINSKTEDFNVDWKDYDVILYTPTICAGISIECDIKQIFCYFTSMSCAADICIQMLGRSRNLIDNTYHMTIQNRFDITPIEIPDILTYINNYRNLGYRYYKNDDLYGSILKNVKYDNYSAEYVSSPYLEGWINYINHINRSKNNLASEIMCLLDLINLKYEYNDCKKINILKSATYIKTVNPLLRLFNQNQIKKKYALYSILPVISDEKYNLLKKKHKKTNEDKDLLNIYTITVVIKKPISSLGYKLFKKIIDNFNGVIYNHKMFGFNQHYPDINDLEKIVDSNITDKSLVMKAIYTKQFLKHEYKTVNQSHRDFYLRTKVNIKLLRQLGLKNSSEIQNNINVRSGNFCEFIKKNKNELICLFNKRKIHLNTILNTPLHKITTSHILRFYNSIFKYIGKKIYSKIKQINGIRIKYYDFDNSYSISDD